MIDNTFREMRPHHKTDRKLSFHLPVLTWRLSSLKLHTSFPSLPSRTAHLAPSSVEWRPSFLTLVLPPRHLEEWLDILSLPLSLHGQLRRKLLTLVVQIDVVVTLVEGLRSSGADQRRWLLELRARPHVLTRRLRGQFSIPAIVGGHPEIGHTLAELLYRCHWGAHGNLTVGCGRAGVAIWRQRTQQVLPVIGHWWRANGDNTGVVFTGDQSEKRKDHFLSEQSITNKGFFKFSVTNAISYTFNARVHLLLSHKVNLIHGLFGGFKNQMAIHFVRDLLSVLAFPVSVVCLLFCF